MIIQCPIGRLHELLPMGRRFFDLSPEHGAFSDEAFMTYWISRYTTSSGTLLVDEVNGEFKGAIGLISYNEMCTGELSVSEVCWYSEGKNGIKLLTCAIDLAKDAGAKIFYLQHINDERVERMKKVYEHFGFKLEYLRYVKEL